MWWVCCRRRVDASAWDGRRTGSAHKPGAHVQMPGPSIWGVSGALDGPAGVVWSGEEALTEQSGELRRGPLMEPAAAGVEVDHLCSWIKNAHSCLSCQSLVDCCSGLWFLGVSDVRLKGLFCMARRLC